MNNKRGLKNLLLLGIIVIAIISIIQTNYIAKKNLVVDTSNVQINEMNPSTKTEKEPPENPGGDNNTPPSMPSSNDTSTDLVIAKRDVRLTALYYLAFGGESLVLALALVYLLLSKFNNKTWGETFSNSDKVLIYVLGSLLIMVVSTMGSVIITNRMLNNNSKAVITDKTSSKQDNVPRTKDKPGVEVTSSKEATGKISVSDEQELSEDYESSIEDESVILVTEGGNLSITGSKINKSGDASNTENSDFYGVNAAVLVQSNSIATIKDAEINTNAKGSNAVFSTGENSKIYISDSTITSNGLRSARGLDATYNGYIEADNVTITTTGASSATLATDRGEGTVKVSNSKLTTNGAGSPVIYSTGDISINNTTGVANGSQMVVVEGKNSATITDSTLIASGKGNRNDVDKAGIMIYQSMSGDASEGKGTFTVINSSLSISENSDVYKTAPMFFVTNTTAEINLTNTKLSYGSNILLSIAGTSEWGTSGSNGGIVTLNTNNQTMKGDIILDSLSSLDMSFVKTSYKGKINSTNMAKEVSLKLDKDSQITLTGDSYVTSLSNDDNRNSNIEFNGYKLYVNGVAIN